jgi:O-antigen/teichoic acid export membrane protein
MHHSELKTKTTKSLFWSFLDRFGEQVIYLASSIVLMNIIDPSEYGLMGVLLIFIVISRLLADSGFGRALLNQKTISDKELSSVFYFNIGLSFLLYFVFFLCTPLIAWLFDEPSLMSIAKVLFLGFVFHSFGLIPQMLLMKKGDFRGLTKINIPALLVAAAVAIVMAVNGFGVWALVAQSVIYAFLRTIFLWIYSSWRPVAHFSLNVIKSLFAFSNKLLLSGFIASFFNNIYPSIIAIFYPNAMNQVGYFTQANKYQDVPFGVISNTFRAVAMVTLSEINQETERMKRVVGKTMKSIAFLAFPIGLFMILVAEPVFSLLFGERWLPAVPYFQGLALAGMLTPFTFILKELFIARRRADFFLGVEVVKRVILVLLIVLLFQYGIMGLVASWVIYTFITLIISLVLSRKLIDYTLLDFLKDAVPYLFIALVSVAVAYFATLQILHNWLFLLISAVAVFGSYWLICKVMKLEMMREIERLVFQSLKK